MKATEAWLERLRWQAATHPCRVVLPEGDQARVREAATLVRRQGMARLTLLGTAPEGSEAEPEGTAWRDPASDEDRHELAGAYFEKGRGRGLSPELAREALGHPLWYGAMLVDQGLAEGLVSGLTHPISDTIRAGIQTMGLAPGAEGPVAASLVIHPDPSLGEEGAMLFADTGAWADPDPARLADIARAAARVCAKVLQAKPRVAFVSASHRGSLNHEGAERIRAAVARIREAAPNLRVDGEVHLDSALRRKPGDLPSTWAPSASGANVLVFPGLDAADAACRAAAVLGGAHVFGPMILGLARPAIHLPETATPQDLADHVALIALLGAP